MPTQQLGRANGVEWMLAERGVEQLEHSVPGSAAGFILRRLLNELVDVDVVIDPASAGHLQERAHRRIEILRPEQPSPIA
jgi:hypothetical protein